MQRPPESRSVSTLNRRAFATGAALAALVVSGDPAMAATTSYGIPRVSLPDFPAEGVPPGSGAAWASLLATTTILGAATDGLIHGNLALSWSLSKSRDTVNLHIRSDALFADGTSIRPEDVVASMRRARENAVGTSDAWRWEHVVSISHVEGNMVRLDLSQPDASIPSLLSTWRVPVVPESWIAGASGMPAWAPASGSFQLDYVMEGRMRFSRNDGFFQVGRPRLTGVLCNAPTGAISRATELVAGGVDIVIDAPLLDVPMLKEDPSVILVGGATNQLCLLTVNLRSSAVARRQFRHLVSSAIDRQRLVEAATANEAVPAMALIPPDHWAGLDLAAEAADPDDVRTQLEELGEPPGIELRLVASDADASLANACVLLQEQLAFAGIALSLDLLSDSEMALEMEQGTWDLLMSYTEAWRDPHELVRPLLTSDGSLNASGYDNDRVNYLVDLATRARSNEYRGGLYQTIQQIVANDVPVIPLFFPNYYDAMSERIGNYAFYPPISATAMNMATMRKPDPVVQP